MYSALLLLCAFGNRGVASLTLDIPQVLTPPTNSSPVVWLSNASNPTPSTLENLAQSFPALTSLSYECDKENFGQPTFDSCMDAYRQLPALVVTGIARPNKPTISPCLLDTQAVCGGPRSILRAWLTLTTWQPMGLVSSKSFLQLKAHLIS